MIFEVTLYLSNRGNKKIFLLTYLLILLKLFDFHFQYNLESINLLMECDYLFILCETALTQLAYLLNYNCT